MMHSYVQNIVFVVIVKVVHVEMFSNKNSRSFLRLLLPLGTPLIMDDSW
jgi:hypothetical protein